MIHPDSKKQIIGFTIPCWEKVIQLSKDVARHYPNATISGWDFAICDDGNIELIEGNSKPDFDVVQHAANRGMRDVLNLIAKK